ncbi:hypothetical protein O181_082745 [Austropuccinia psidii MF-1]|uniref:Uncharacterized protein n=1 Tax=Austropuccinia psidii MF-1 TaxID=1389203 RepID=A0A9Q3FLS1_9BASI|nr:hypothetical protein [Austropuccinia psidii MF-1]
MNSGFDYNNQFALQFSSADGAPQQNPASSRGGRKRPWSVSQDDPSACVNFVDENHSQDDLGTRTEDSLQNSETEVVPFTFYPRDVVVAILATMPTKKRGHGSRSNWVKDLVEAISELPNWKIFLENSELSDPVQQTSRLNGFASFLWELNARTLNVFGVGSYHHAFGIEEKALKKWVVEEVEKILTSTVLEGKKILIDQECFKKLFSGSPLLHKKPRLWNVCVNTRDTNEKQSKIVEELEVLKTKAIINILGSYYKIKNPKKWEHHFNSDEKFVEKTLMYARHKTYIKVGGWGEPKKESCFSCYFPWANPELPRIRKYRSGPTPVPLSIKDLAFEIDDHGRRIEQD